MANLADQLRDLVQNGDQVPAAPAQEAATDNFSAKPKKEKTEEEKRADQARALYSSQMAEKLRAKATGADSPRGMLLTAMSKNSAICGYVCKSDTKTDFYAKHFVNKDDKNKPGSYAIMLRNSPPSAVEGIIYTYPAALSDLLAQGTAITNDELSTASASNMSMVAIEPKETFAQLLVTKFAGYMAESEKIFEPYTTKAGTVASYGDVKGLAGVPAKPCLYIATAPGAFSDDKTKAGKVLSIDKIYRLRHTLRNRWQTPKNTLALKCFETVPMKMQYSADEATIKIKEYLARFTKQPVTAGKTRTVDMLTSSNSANFTLSVPDMDQPNVSILATTFFPTTSSDNWSSNPDLKVPDWYKRNADGSPVAIPFGEIKLVRKEIVKDTARIMSKEIRDTSASADSYRFEPTGKHKAIVDATGGLLTFDVISTFRPTKKKSTSAKVTGVNQLRGSDLAGLTPEEVVAALRGAI